MTRIVDHALDLVPLPSWLTQNVPSDKDHPDSLTGKKDAAVQADTATARKDPRTDSSPASTIELQQASGLELAENTCSTERLIRSSQKVFQGMIQQDIPIETLINFLETSKLNVIGAQNLPYLLATQSKSTATKLEDLETLCRWLSTQMRLGLLPPVEVLSILEAIAQTKDDKLTTLSSQSLYRTVFEGIASLPAVYTHWHSPRFQAFNALLVSTPPEALSWATQNLGVGIIRSLQTTIDTPIKTSLDLFLESWCVSSDLEVADDGHTGALGDRAFRILDMLQRMPRYWLLRTIRARQWRFLEKFFATDDGISAFLNHWKSPVETSFLRDLWPRLEEYLATKKPAVLAKYLQTMDHRAKCGFLIRHWYGAEWYDAEYGVLIADPRRALKPLLSSHLEARFEASLQENPKRSPFINLLQALRALDYYPRAREQILLFRLLRALNMHGTILALVATSQQTHMHFNARVIKTEILHNLSIGRQRIAYRIFQAYHHLSLEHVPELAEAIISRPNLHPDAALRYRSSRRKRLGSTKEFERDRSFLDNLRVELLNRMALAYAKARHLHHRRAFRKVRACYLRLRGEHLPLRPDLIRAMTHAGVIRYLEAGEWVSTARFIWILNFVRQVEGKDVADKLHRLVWDWRGEILDRRRSQGVPRTCLSEEPVKRKRIVVGPKRTRAPGIKWWKCDGE